MEEAKQAVTSPEDTEDLSPAPQAQAARRRGGISAEPVTEEDATSYVKKVNTQPIYIIIILINIFHLFF